MLSASPLPFVNACSSFLYVDSLGEFEAADTPGSRAPDATAESTGGEREAVTNPKLSLAQDTKLVAALRGGVEASIREDGWAPLSTAGGAVKRQAPIDPRNYGVKNFTALFEATGLFEIFKSESGQPYIADKRNKDRTARPEIKAASI
jgi:hypothetical protein